MIGASLIGGVTGATTVTTGLAGVAANTLGGATVGTWAVVATGVGLGAGAGFKAVLGGTTAAGRAGRAGGAGGAGGADAVMMAGLSARAALVVREAGTGAIATGGAALGGATAATTGAGVATGTDCATGAVGGAWLNELNPLAGLAGGTLMFSHCPDGSVNLGAELQPNSKAAQSAPLEASLKSIMVTCEL